MKAIYESVLTQIKDEVPAIRWTDFDLGQLDTEVPPVAFPCALVDISGAQVQQLGDAALAEQVAIEVTLAFRLRERTHSLAEDTFRDEALQHLDTVEALRAALTGLTAPAFAPIAYEGFSRDRRADLRVYRIRFACTRYPDDSGSAGGGDAFLPWDEVTGTVGAGPGFCVHLDII
jgi:hypothetical protein